MKMGGPDEIGRVDKRRTPGRESKRLAGAALREIGLEQ
jgi:hypothetical protein